MDYFDRLKAKCRNPMSGVKNKKKKRFYRNVK